MERLTKWLNGKTALCFEPCEIECTEGYYECHKCKPFADAMKKLAEYEDAEEQGLLLRLPCKVGDTVYVIPSRVNCALNRLNGHSENNRVYVQRIHSIQMYSNDIYLLTTCEGLQSVLSDYYKETWFITKEEAEAALEKLKGNERR